ncbi:heterokaryon incompatibility protein-domain-containing protein [Xylaria arbuscula]|nr:heterokaryon incompatibility protein-domain-containing protein [Xylaria arbuscula]
MPKVQLNLKGPPFPRGLTLKDIRSNPRVCNTCYNLSPGTAAAFFPSDTLATRDLDMMEENISAAESLGIMESKPTWITGCTRTDYIAYEARAPLSDIIQGVHRDCPSCILLEAAITNLYSDALCLKNPKDLMVYIFFCLGRVVRVDIYDEPPIQENDSDDDMFPVGYIIGADYALGVRAGKELLGPIELYTLPGQPSPWPTIGCSIPYDRRESSRREENPRTSRESKIISVVSHVLPNPASEPGFRLVKEWLKRCVADHTDCREADLRVKHNRLPKRVIQVGSWDNSEIRLCENDGGNEQQNSVPDEPYLSLSHCWGDSSNLPMLTKDTLEEKKKNIQWDSIPRTFRDAIVLTRGIGIHYIWIDSLCIIQDDPDDWKNEASKMASIYEGALMVLSATASTNSDGGCFHDREPPVVLQVALESEPPSTIFARRVLPHRAFRSGFMEYQQTNGIKDPLLSEGVPLFSRAWCFQERLLGTRTLQFLSQEMVFDCLESTNCECGGLSNYTEESTKTMRKSIKHGIPAEIISRWWRGSHLEPDQYIAPSSAQLFDDVFNETWRGLVESYSQKNITYSSDTLPALSGLANRWSRITGKDYLCGLWTDGLLPGLLWYAGNSISSTGVDRRESIDKRFARDKDTYIAPTWSWASTRRPVAWPPRDFVEL